MFVPDILQTPHSFKYTMKARPVILIACFEKSNMFKRLMDNILESFGSGTASMPMIKSTTSGKDENGNTITKYIADGHRYFVDCILTKIM